MAKLRAGHTIGDRTYNGLTMAEIVDNWGLRKLGIENLPPLLARGVLVDVPRLVGRALWRRVTG